MSRDFARTVEPRVGIEPTTCRLRKQCSTPSTTENIVFTGFPAAIIKTQCKRWNTVWNTAMIQCPNAARHNHQAWSLLGSALLGIPGQERRPRSSQRSQKTCADWSSLPRQEIGRNLGMEALGTG